MKLRAMRTAVRTRLKRSGGPDRGGMSISMAIVFPVFMLFLLGTIQACLWWYAREAALHAAKEGVEEGRITRGDQQAGETRARNVAADLGGGVLRGVTVTTPTNNTERIEIRVQGTSLSIVPGLPAITIVQSATGPMERWIPAR